MHAKQKLPQCSRFYSMSHRNYCAPIFRLRARCMYAEEGVQDSRGSERDNFIKGVKIEPKNVNLIIVPIPTSFVAAKNFS